MKFNWQGTEEATWGQDIHNILNNNLEIPTNNIVWGCSVYSCERYYNDPQIKIAYFPYAYEEKFSLQIAAKVINSPDEMKDLIKNRRLSLQDRSTYLVAIELLVTRRSRYTTREIYEGIELNSSLVMPLTTNQSHYVRAVTLNEKVVWIGTNKIDKEFLLKLSAMLPVIFPAFNKEPYRSFSLNIATDNLTKYVTLFRETYVAPIMEKIKNQIWIKLQKDLLNVRSLQIKQADDICRMYEQDERDKISSLKILYQRQREAELKLFALKHQEAEDFSSLINILKAETEAGNIQDFTVKGSEIIINAVVPLTYWDQSIAENLLNTSRRNALTYNFKEVWRSILIDQTATLRLWTAFRLDLVNARILVDFDTPQPPNTIPNEHLLNFECWGSNESRIMQALRGGYYDAALLQALSAVQSLNLTDSTVMESLVEKITEECTNYSKPCIQDKETGEIFTWISYEIYLMKKEQEANESIKDDSPGQEPDPNGVNQDAGQGPGDNALPGNDNTEL